VELPYLPLTCRLLRSSFAGVGKAGFASVLTAGFTSGFGSGFG